MKKIDFMGTSTLLDTLQKENKKCKCVSRKVSSDQFMSEAGVLK